MSATLLSPTRRELLAATAAAGAISMLPGTLRAAAGDDSIRPFTVSFPQEELAELRRRIAATRWPERELVSDAASRRIWSTPAGRRNTRRATRHDAEAHRSTGERNTIGANARRG